MLSSRLTFYDDRNLYNAFWSYDRSMVAAVLLVVLVFSVPPLYTARAELALFPR